MTATFISPAAIERLRNEARKKGVLVWIDAPARHSGKPFIWLKKKNLVLYEFWDDADALAWLGVKP